MSEQAALPAKKKSILPWILLGCGCLGIPAVIGVVFVALAFIGGAAAIALFMAPVNAAKTHVRLAQSDPAAAYDACAEEMKATMTLEQFRASVESRPLLYGSREVSFSNTQINNGIATLHGTASGPDGTVSVTFVLVSRGSATKEEDWHVMEVTTSP